MADAQLTYGRAEDFVLVSKPKKGTAFVEARLNEGYTYTDKGWQQILACLERELSPDKLNDDAFISLETDLTDTPLYKHVPQGIFQSLRVVDIQGLDPATRKVSARDVAIKFMFNPYKLSSETFDLNKATVLPTAAFDGLWELSANDDTRPQLARWSRYAQILLHMAVPGHDFKDITTKAIKSPSTLHIVLVDNIRSYGWTWSPKEPDPEVQTTTCPVGFDTLEALPNVLAICTSSTSNLPIQSSFSRIARTVRVASLLSPPMWMPQRYEILRSLFQAYADAGIITCNDKLDDYRNATNGSKTEKATPGCQILELAEHVEYDMSARLLRQIVIRALTADFKDGGCDMATAVDAVRKCHGLFVARRTTIAKQGSIEDKAQAVAGTSAGVERSGPETKEGPKTASSKRRASCDATLDDFVDVGEACDSILDDFVDLGVESPVESLVTNSAE
ncbi:hypothetical protein CKAH01_17694 [Colletotrichum kahawae]|uniref:Uncharacterized protein n=1 Tax=Colletotrichum kahawae TaxID=34407 RepID=A0AAE0D4A3_COLKA|nr:hypothetical protein CKAH01_17694 [Colletotrichum kahawae]